MDPASPGEACIIQEWLRSLGLAFYTQDFLDNGYDDLEVCKQIGDADLDAIGVEEQAHRRIILAAVQILREQGGARVYFTLDPDYQYQQQLKAGLLPSPPTAGLASPGDGPCPDYEYNVPPPPPPSLGSADGDSLDYEEARKSLVTFPVLQLASIIRDRLHEENIDALQLYNNQVEGTTLEQLAQRYGDELNTHLEHVMYTLVQLANQPPTPDKSGLTNAGQRIPPPLPTCPPPSSSYVEPVDLQTGTMDHSSSPRRHVLSMTTGRTGSVEQILPETDDKKKGSTLGRFFKNVAIRKSGRKFSYKQHEGDLHASEITMSDEDRIELMIKVKEGKISMHDAVEIVKHYEETKRQLQDSPKRGPEELALPTRVPRHSCKSSPFPFFKLPSFRKKNDSAPPQKPLTDSPRRRIPMSQSHDDYYEPPSEGLRDKASPLRRSGQSDHSGAYLSFLQSRVLDEFDYRGPYDTYHPMQWISPMLLRKYVPESSPRERKGLFSSPFIKRKGSLDSKVLTNNFLDAHRKSRVQRQVSDEPGHMTSHVRGVVTNGCADRVSHGGLRLNGVDRLERLSQGSGSSQSLSSTLSRHEHTLAVEVHRDSTGDGTHNGRQDLHWSPQRRLASDDAWNYDRPHGRQSVIDSSNKLSSSVICNSQMSPQLITSHENALYMKVQDGEDLDKGTRDSPDLGVEDTSPTGTLDSTASEDFKDSKYGSSSTMSIGSDASPVAEQRKGQHHSKARSQHLNTNNISNTGTGSAGEDCLSSDYDDQEDSGQRCSSSDGTSSSITVKETCTCQEPMTGRVGHGGRGTPGPLSSATHRTSSPCMSPGPDVTQSPRRMRAGKKSPKRPRPKTLEDLLTRLSLQHLFSVFISQGYSTLELFSEVEEEDLDDLAITIPEERAKVLTAAQMLLDYEGTLSAVQSVQNGALSDDNSIIINHLNIKDEGNEDSEDTEMKNNLEMSKTEVIQNNLDAKETSIEERRNGFARSKSCPSYTKEDKEVMEIIGGSSLSDQNNKNRFSHSEAMLTTVDSSTQVYDSTFINKHKLLDIQLKITSKLPRKGEKPKTPVRTVSLPGAPGPTPPSPYKKDSSKTQSDVSKRLNKVSTVRDKV